jgi:hypothetical protein
MKNLIIILILIFTAIVPVFAKDETVTIDELVKAHEYQYVIPLPTQIPNFDEISFGLLTYTETVSFPALLCALQNGDIICVYGAFFSTTTNPNIMIDTDRNGELDYEANENEIPGWVLFAADMKRSNPDEFINFCNKIYEDFNSTAGPSNAKLMQYMAEVDKKVKDKNASNRDLYYNLMYYSLKINNPFIALKTMLALENNIHKIGSEGTSPLFYLYMGESSLNRGYLKSALALFETIKKMHPKSKIAEYYIAYTKDKIDKTSKNMDAFKKGNPDFWMNKK